MWEPQQDSLNQIVGVLRNSFSSDSALQRQSYHALQQYKLNPEFTRYLMHIFCTPTQDQDSNLIRHSAGLAVKNNLLEKRQFSEEEQVFLKNEVFKTIGDPQVPIRRTCALIVTTLIKLGTLRKWPGLLQHLTKSLDSTDMNYVDGSFLTLVTICEDHAEDIVLESSNPLSYMIPKFIQFFSHTHEKFKMYSVDCVAAFLFDCPPFVQANINSIMSGLFFLANDNSPKIRSCVVRSFLILVDSRVNVIETFLPKVIEYILLCTQQTDEQWKDLAKEATEFWTLIAHEPSYLKHYVRPILPQLFNTLLSRMMYSRDELIDIGFVEETSHNPDQSQDIKPNFTQLSGKVGSLTAKEEEDDDDEEDPSSPWSIRKASADALDELSRKFPDPAYFLSQLLPFVEKGLQSNDWLTRESTIMALGCVARGCSREMNQYLAKIVPYLFDMLNDQQFLLRSISCWVLSRYTRWIYDQHDRESYLNRLIRDLINRMKDKNKKVQKTATSALATVVESIGTHIAPYLEAILEACFYSFQTFQKANVMAIYDVITTVSSELGVMINDEKYLKYIIPPLLHKYDNLADNDIDLLSLLSCISAVAMAIGEGFTPYTQRIYERSLKICTMVLQSINNGRNGGEDKVEHDFLTCSLDVLSTLIIALQGKIEPLLVNSNLMNVIVDVCKVSYSLKLTTTTTTTSTTTTVLCIDVVHKVYLHSNTNV
eukprot:TRINITY_DN4689_c0_g1_i2.p1 TRINITY_DN4689_c0_g1~~TRINITY_DN4689_c0_g1_i2.p1  ORF type:complete len:710 (-),score=140.77 TRINITY_DN4689_c0_g1_i2:664-2793(-)